MDERLPGGQRDAVGGGQGIAVDLRLRPPDRPGQPVDLRLVEVSTPVCSVEDPPLDEPGLVEMLKRRAASLHLAHVYPIGALTAKLEGERLTGMGLLAEAGWKENDKDLNSSYMNCMGWSQMLCALKVYVERGFNLREFFY